MPRQAAITPNVLIHPSIPADLHAKLTLHLWSPLEGRIPKGAMQALITTLLTEYLNKVEK